MIFFQLYLAACSISFLLVHAEILDILRIRPFLNKFNFSEKLFKCSFCVSCYLGVILSIFFLPLQSCILFSLSVPAVVFLWDRLVILLDEKIIELENKRQEK